MWVVESLRCTKPAGSVLGQSGEEDGGQCHHEYTVHWYTITTPFFFDRRITSTVELSAAGAELSSG